MMTLDDINPCTECNEPSFLTRPEKYKDLRHRISQAMLIGNEFTTEQMFKLLVDISSEITLVNECPSEYFKQAYILSLVDILREAFTLLKNVGEEEVSGDSSIEELWNNPVSTAEKIIKRALSPTTSKEEKEYLHYEVGNLKLEGKDLISFIQNQVL